MPGRHGLRRRWRFGLQTLLLAPVLLAVLLGIGPGLREEFDRIESHCLIVECTDTVRTWDKTGQCCFETEIEIAAEAPFRVRLWYEEISLPSTGAAPVHIDNARTNIGEFATERHVLGHNYKLALRLRARNGSVSIGNDGAGWRERAFFPTREMASSWRLVEANGQDFSRRWGMDVGYGVWQFVFAPVGADETRPEKNRAFLLWIQCESCERLDSSDQNPR